MQICCKYKQFFCTIYEETFKSFRKIKMKLKLQWEMVNDLLYKFQINKKKRLLKYIQFYL